MDFFRRAWAQIRMQAEKVPASTRFIIASLTVILVLFGLLVLQYAAKPEMVSLMSIPADRQGQAVARLQAAGIKVEASNSQLLVASDKQAEAMAVLAQGEVLHGDTSMAFDQWIQKQNPWTPSDQNARLFLLAKQRALSQIIGKMNGVHSADVILSPVEKVGFGSTYNRPSASVTVVLNSGGSLDKKLGTAVAGLVAGSVAGMKPQDVIVIDANNGRQFTVKDQNEFAPGESDEILQAKEAYVRRKIEDALAYISPRAIVAVNVRQDSVTGRRVEKTEYASSENIKSEKTREQERKEVLPSVEPGARSNVGVSAEQSQVPGTSEKTTENSVEYGEKPVVSRVFSTETGHTTQKINVTVNVPRSYFVNLVKQGKADAPDPDDAALKPIIDQQLAQIEEQVKPLIAAGTDGLVKVSMIPDMPAMFATTAGTFVAGPNGPVRVGSSSDGILSMVDGSMLKTGGLGLLALVSIVLMFGMVRKASQTPRMPSVEELAGVPPTLPVEDDVVGDVESADSGMAGVELDEGDIRTRKIAEQIGELVKSNPAEAAALFNRWIRKEA